MNPKIWLRTAGLVLMMPAAVALAQMPPAPTAGPEHEILKRDVGVWDATIEMQGPPGTPPAVSKGTETIAMTLGGLWQTTQFKGDLMGQVFEGQGITGYDPAKKKYVGSWVDSMSAGLSVVESTYDAAKSTMTGSMEGPGPTGEIVKMKQVVEWKDADTRVFTMHMPLPDGTVFPALKITYKRRK